MWSTVWLPPSPSHSCPGLTFDWRVTNGREWAEHQWLISTRAVVGRSPPTLQWSHSTVKAVKSANYCRRERSVTRLLSCIDFSTLPVKIVERLPDEYHSYTDHQWGRSDERRDAVGRRRLELQLLPNDPNGNNTWLRWISMNERQS